MYLTIDNDSPVRMQTLTRDKAAILACEEYKASRNFTGLSRTTHGRTTELFHGGGVHRRGDERCPD